MSLAQSLLQLAQQSGAKALPVCEKAVVDAAVAAARAALGASVGYDGDGEVP